MKKDIEWLKEEIGDLPIADTIFISDGVSYIDSAVSVMSVYDLIDQLDEPELLSQELPVVPKFIANFIEARKHVFVNTLQHVIHRAMENRKSELFEDEYNWVRDNSETFARAWLDGYTVKAEQKYYAMVKGHELLNDVAKYWAHNKYDLEDLFISYETRDDSPIVVKNTKNHWDDLGINDSNADFIKVEVE